MSKSFVTCATEVVELISLWTIGSTGAHTKTSGVGGEGFDSVARTAAGKYTVTFSKGTPRGTLVSLELVHWPAADAQPLDLRPSVGTWTPETSAAKATVKYEAWDNDTTAQTELASGDKVTIKAVFLKTKAA